jgi:DNA repair protein RadC
MALTDWPEDERPREKLLARGAAALSDAELLAIFLRVGIPGKNAVDMARDLLIRFGSLTRLLTAGERELCDVRGMGQAKYVQLQATLEIAQRTLREDLRQRDALNAPAVVRNYLQLALGNRHQEVFLVLFLDTQNRVLASEELFHGTLNHASVYPREVVKRALAHNAAAVILAHNHPSGIAEPSQSDRQLTQQLKQALALVGVHVLDHFIIAETNYLSFAEHGVL